MRNGFLRNVHPTQRSHREPLLRARERTPRHEPHRTPLQTPVMNLTEHHCTRARSAAGARFCALWCSMMRFMTGVSTSKECTQERRLARNAFVSNTRPGQQTIENHCAQEPPAAERALVRNGFLSIRKPQSASSYKKTLKSQRRDSLIHITCLLSMIFWL